jgi:PAS domain S-box-containing protein
MEIVMSDNDYKIPDFLSGDSQMTRLIGEYDWSGTSIGPMDKWPQSLKTVLNTILKSKFPMLIWWGDDLIQFYNDPYRSILGKDGKHPGALGQKGKDAWAETWSILKSLIDQVITKNESIFRENQPVPIYRNSKLEDAYWTSSYSPVNDDSGNIGGVLVVTTETTQYVNSIDSIKQSEERFQNLVREATVGIIVMIGEEMKIEIVNEAYGRLINRTTEELLGKPLFDIIPEATDPFMNILNNVRLSGVPVYLYDHSYFVFVDGEKKEGYLNLVYQPYKDSNGVIVGVMALCHDVTEQVHTRHKIEASEFFAKTIINRSEAAQAVWLGENMVFDMANEKMLEMLGRDNSIMGKPFMEAIPELKETLLLQRLRNVLKTGKTYYQPEEMFVIMRHGVPHTGYYNYSYAVLTNPAGQNYGIICTASDVTEQVVNRKKIEQAEAKARLAIDSASLGTYEIDYATDEMITSGRFNEIWGIKHGLTRKDIVGRIHPDDIPARQKSHNESLTTGNLHYEARIIWDDNTEHWVRVKGKVVHDEKGKPITLLGVVQDINEQRLSAERLTELVEERTGELVQKHAALLESEERYHRMVGEVEDYAILFLDKEGIIQNWNKGAEKIKGYTAEEATGKSFKMFYSREDRERKLPESLMAQAAKTGKAAQEGVRIRKDGSSFWGSIVITALHDVDNNIIGYSKVTRDLTERKIAEDKIRQYTAELEFQNEELKQFAFVASHDMKEPLRKVIFNNNFLYDRIYDRLDDKEKIALQRSTDGAKRMQTLIDDILSYSQTAFAEHTKEKVDLNITIQNVISNLKEVIEELEATIELPSMPAIHGIPHQLSQLFDNLLNNSLKYRHPGRSPVIKITFQTISDSELNKDLKQREYYKISIADNGIGFEGSDAEKIFDLFYRLNNRKQYTGSGIGLSICRKIVQNHNGLILAFGHPGFGAEFDIYLPRE